VKQVLDGHRNTTDADPNAWPTVHVPGWPDDEYPKHQPTDNAKKGSGSVFMSHIREEDDIAAASPFPVFNILRTNTSKRGLGEPLPLPADWCTEPGKPYQIFKPGPHQFFWFEGGSFLHNHFARKWKHKVQTTFTLPTHLKFSHEPPPSGPYQFVMVTDKELWQITEDKCEHALKIKTAAYNLDKSSGGRAAGQRRTNRMTLVTPARFFHGEGECMFDTRPLHDAADPSTASVGVFNHHRSLQEHGPSRPRYNTEEIQRTFLASGQTDHDRLEEMTTLGFRTHSEGPRDAIIADDYRTIDEHAVHCEKLKCGEEQDGIVSKPYPRPPLYPSQTQPGLAVEQPDKLRICIAMNGPLDDDIGGGSMSVNANIDMDDTSKVPRLVLPSAQSFERGIGILMAGLNKSTHPVFVFASDWKRFYRQLPKFLKDLFHQITAIGKSGFRIEWFMMFGDGAAPAGANGAEDSFIQMIYYYMNGFVAKAHEHQWPSEEYWAELERWLAAREEHSKKWETPAGISTAQWKKVQLIFIVIQGFFDDSLGGAPGSPPQRDGNIGTCVGIFPLLVNAVVSFAKDHGIEISAHKLKIGAPDRTTGLFDLDTWEQDYNDQTIPAWKRRVQWRIHPDVKDMSALGKDINIGDELIPNTPSRIAAMNAAVTKMCHTANATRCKRTNRPTCGFRVTRRLIGQAFHAINTESHLRATLNKPVRMMRLGNALYPELERVYRTKVNTKHRPAPSFSIAFLDEKVQRDWHQLMAGLQQAKGQPFVPMKLFPGMNGRTVRWMCCDASGKERAAGGAATFTPGKPASVLLTILPWKPGQWEGVGLSTLQEGFTASTCAKLLLQSLPEEADIIECMDSESATFIHRSGKAGSESRSEDVAIWRQQLMTTFPRARIFTLHNVREKGRIPDALSNVFLPFQPPFTHPQYGWGHHQWTGITWAIYTMHTYGITDIEWQLTIPDGLQVQVYISGGSNSPTYRPNVVTMSTTVPANSVCCQRIISLNALTTQLALQHVVTNTGPSPWVVAAQLHNTIHVALMIPLTPPQLKSLPHSKWQEVIWPRSKQSPVAALWDAIYKPATETNT